MKHYFNVDVYIDDDEDGKKRRRTTTTMDDNDDDDDETDDGNDNYLNPETDHCNLLNSLAASRQKYPLFLESRDMGLWVLARPRIAKSKRSLLYIYIF